MRAKGPAVLAPVKDPFIIAEIGHNHQGSVELCKRLFAAAKQSGADAVKLQKKDYRNLYTDAFFNSEYHSENAFGKTYGEHKAALEFEKEEYETLKGCAEEIGITFFATAFDIASADFLRDFPIIKIASCDLSNIPLLKHVKTFGKPIILSTGGHTEEDVDRAYRILDGSDLTIMQCTSSYPADPSTLDLGVIPRWKHRYDCRIGYSGHDNTIAMPLAAYVLGATVIEKHFTLDRSMKGTDNIFSLNAEGMRKLVRDIHRYREASGDKKRLHDCEQGPMRKMRKALVATKDLPVGHRCDLEVRVAEGLPPYEEDYFAGRTLTKALKRHEPITKSHVQDDSADGREGEARNILEGSFGGTWS